MVYVLIGSYALHSRLPEAGIRPKDRDYICTFDEANKVFNKLEDKTFQPYAKDHWIGIIGYTFYDFLIPNSGSTKLIYDFVLNDTNTRKHAMAHNLIPSLDVLYTIKMSHRFKKTNRISEFEKTLSHILLMEKNGAKITDDLKEIYKIRMEETYNYSHPKLNKTKSEFFTDDVPYIYDHDTIHEAVKFLDKPMYRYFIIPEQEVLCSKELFNALSHNDKLLAVYEEASVLALERSIIPYKITDQDKIKEKFRFALMKVCTSITSGWFREFAWRNYFQVLKMNTNNDFYFKFLDGLDSGIVKKMER